MSQPNGAPITPLGKSRTNFHRELHRLQDEVLVLGSEESLLYTLRYNLARASHEVRLCADGLKGLEMARGNPPNAYRLFTAR